VTEGKVKKDHQELQEVQARREAARSEKERGFTLLGVLIAVLIMGTMATVAVPRFTAALASANTTKIQADLAAIDTAVALYSIDKGTLPTTVSQLQDYLENSADIKPPTGKCNVNGATIDVPGTEYSLAANNGSMQARLGNYNVYDFARKSASTAGSSTGSSAGSGG